MWEHPYHFPLAVWPAVSGWGDRLWQELVGIVGWQDILLPTWTYLVLTALLFLVPLQKLWMSGATRARVAVISGLVVLSYVIVVYLIFYLTYKSLDADHVRGVQGRYFVIVLPVAAICVATVINRELPSTLPAAIAITGSVMAGSSNCKITLPGTFVISVLGRSVVPETKAPPNRAQMQCLLGLMLPALRLRPPIGASLWLRSTYLEWTSS